jgi:hypothetical protein
VGGRADALVSQFRLLMALRELSGGAMLTQICVGASTVHVVACARFLVAIIPHVGVAGACDVEVLHFAHMLQLLYPVELGARKIKAEKKVKHEPLHSKCIQKMLTFEKYCQHEADDAAHSDVLDEEYSAQREMGSEIEEHLDQDAESDALFASFQSTYLDPALSRPPASSRWLSPLAACPGVVHACIVAHMLPLDGVSGGEPGGSGGDLLILTSGGQSAESAPISARIHSCISSQARARQGPPAWAKGKDYAGGLPRGGVRLWEWLTSWSRIVCSRSDEAGIGEREGGGGGVAMKGKRREGGGVKDGAWCYQLPRNSVTNVFGLPLSVLVAPTGHRACGAMSLSIIVFLSDASPAAEAGWSAGLRLQTVLDRRGAGGGQTWGGMVGEGDSGSYSGGGGGYSGAAGAGRGGGRGEGGKEGALVGMQLGGREGECLCAAIEALDIAFPSTVPATNVPLPPTAHPPRVPHPPTHPPTQHPAAQIPQITHIPMLPAAQIPIPPKRQRGSSAGPRRPHSRGGNRPPSADGMNGRLGKQGTEWAGDEGREFEGDGGLGGGGGADGSYQIFSLSQPLMDSRGRESTAGLGGHVDAYNEPFDFEIGGRASRLRSETLRSNKFGGGEGGGEGSGSGVRSSAGAGHEPPQSSRFFSSNGAAGRSETLRSSRLYQDLGFATPRKQEPASDTNPYRLVDLYKGTPEKQMPPGLSTTAVVGGGGGGGGGKRVQADDDDSEIPLSLEMLEGGGGGGPGGVVHMKGVVEEEVTSPATNLSHTLDDMAL